MSVVVAYGIGHYYYANEQAIGWFSSWSSSTRGGSPAELSGVAGSGSWDDAGTAARRSERRRTSMGSGGYIWGILFRRARWLSPTQ